MAKSISATFTLILIAILISAKSPALAVSNGDFNGDGHVNLADYNKLVAGFGTTYTLADYNALVANFGTNVATSSPAPTANVLWRGDAETGDISQWCNVVRSETDRIQVVTSPVSQGNYAYRIELRNGDVTSGVRTTLNNGLPEKPNCQYESNGEEKYYGWSVMLPTNYPDNTEWSLVAQWKGIHTGSPPIQLGLRNGNWQLAYRPNTGSSNIVKWVTPVTKGRYEKFVMHVKWSTSPSVGFIELWHNGVLVVPKFYTSNIHLENGNPVRNFVAIGLYRSSSITDDIVLYHDGFRVGTTYASVAQ